LTKLFREHGEYQEATSLIRIGSSGPAPAPSVLLASAAPVSLITCRLPVSEDLGNLAVPPEVEEAEAPPAALDKQHIMDGLHRLLFSL
jgi:hypothetical protein